MPAARIKPQSLADKPYEFISILIKGKAAPRGGWSPGLEPIAVDPGHLKLLAQNDKVTVMRAIWGPGESSPGFFYAFGAAMVTLTAVQLEVTLPDRKKIYPSLPAGAAVWFPPGLIRPRNIAESIAEFIVVEPRPAM